MSRRIWMLFVTLIALVALVLLLSRQNIASTIPKGDTLPAERPENRPLLPAVSTLSPSLFETRESSNESELYRHAQATLYSTTISPSDVCSNNTFLLVVVISKPSNQKHRQVYRNTVLAPITNQCLTDTKYLFLIGQSGYQELETHLQEENEQYGDLLQGNFLDTYDNLTIKSLFYLQWIRLNCPEVSFVLKLDDDVFTVIQDVRHYLTQNSLPKNTIAGAILRNIEPVKDPSNKWYVVNYAGKVYPTYVSGTAYILPCNLLEPIFRAAISSPFLRLEDAFVTGVAVRATGLDIKHRQLPGFASSKENVDGLNLAVVNFHVNKLIHGTDGEQLRFLHKRLERERPCVP